MDGSGSASPAAHVDRGRLIPGLFIHQAWSAHPYLVNVAPYKPGLDIHSGWKRINGFSERLVDYIRLEEAGAFEGVA